MPILKARAVAGVIVQAITVAVIVVAGEADEAFAEGVRGRKLGLRSNGVVS
jgi:hypothetical protein